METSGGSSQIRRRPGSRWLPLAAGLLAAHFLLPAKASLNEIPDLRPPEREAARVSQAIYEELREMGEERALPEDQQALFDKLEELVHTANELLMEEEDQRFGPTDRSLQIDMDGLRLALDWVSNSEASSGSGVTMGAAHVQFPQAARRMAALQASGAGIARAGRQPSGDDDVLSLVRRDASLGGGASADLVTPWGFFVNVDYSLVDHDRTAQENAFEIDHYGLTLGLDYRWTDATVIGGSVGFARADLDFAEKGGFDGGGMDVDGYNVSAYLIHDVGDFYFNGMVTLGWMDFDLTRNITYESNNPNVPDTNNTAVSSTDGNHYLISLGTGYQYDMRPTTFTPFARFDVLRAEIDGYRESDGGPFNLEVDSQTIRSARSTLGFDVTRPISTGFGVLIPRTSAEWHHEFRDTNPEVGSRFVADPTGTTFFSPGDDTDRNFASLSGSLSVILPRGIQAFAEARTIFGLSNTSVYSFTAGLRGEF